MLALKELYIVLIPYEIAKRRLLDDSDVGPAPRVDDINVGHTGD